MRKQTLERHLATIRRLEKEHGMLPSSGWLNQNGHSGLASYLRKFPERFADIKQQSAIQFNIERHLATIRRLEKEHGKLPSSGWLNQNGHSELASSLLQDGCV